MSGDKDNDKDVALLRLNHPINFSINEIPIYHGYIHDFDDETIIFGSSRKSNDASNNAASLYKISALVISDNKKDSVGGSAFMSEIHPESGGTQGGDSGGPMLVNLRDKFSYEQDDYLKIIGILSTGTESEEAEVHYSEHAKLNESVLLWLGDHLGMITAPNDGDIIPESQSRIRVEVTNAREQPIVKVQMLDLKTRNPLIGPEYVCGAIDIATCTIARPATAGNYLIAAYREDGTYDSVVITTKIQRADACLTFPQSTPGCSH